MHDVNSCPIAVVQHARIIVYLRVLTLVIVLLSSHCLRSSSLIKLLLIVLLLIGLRSITVERCSKLSSLELLLFIQVVEE